MASQSHTVWLAANGPGPWPCTFCGDPVPHLGGHGTRGPAYGIIHHADHNHGNNAIGNLRAAHDGCHFRYHCAARGRTGYLEVAEMLAARIDAAEPGSRLMSEQAFAKELGVAYRTVRRAMDVLRERGLIVTRWGKGTFVRGEEQ